MNSPSRNLDFIDSDILSDQSDMYDTDIGSPVTGFGSPNGSGSSFPNPEQNNSSHQIAMDTSTHSPNRLQSRTPVLGGYKADEVQTHQILQNEEEGFDLVTNPTLQQLLTIASTEQHGNGFTGNAALVSCTKCQATFISVNARDNHTRTVHQAISYHKTESGETVQTTRGEDGYFVCPNQDCNYKSQRAAAIWRHWKSCTIKKELQPLLRVDLPDPLIENSNIALVPASGLLLTVCLLCQQCMHPDEKSIINHLRNCQKKRKRSEISAGVNFKLQLREKLALARVTPLNELKDSPFMNPMSSVLDPVPGIAVHNGYRCLCCVYYCVERSTMNVHRRKNHSERTLENMSEQCHVQTLFRGSLTTYFGISSSSAVISNDELISALDNAVDDGINLKANIREESSVRLSPWLRRSRWDRTAEVMLPTPEDVEKVLPSISKDIGVYDLQHYESLSSIVKAYMAQFHKHLSEVNYMFRRIVMSCGTELEVVGINPLQEQSTRDRYSDVMLRTILLLIRGHGVNADKFVSIPWISDQDTALKTSLQTLTDCMLRQQGQSNVPLESINAFHDVVLALATPPLTIDVYNSAWCVQMHMVLLLSLNISGKEYTFKDARHITQPIAIFQYWIRASILMEMAKQMWDPNASQLTNEKLEFFKVYTSENGNNTPLLQLRQTMRLASSVAAEEPVKPHLIVIGNGTGCALNGQEIFLSDFQSIIARLIARATKIMNEDLLRGLNTEWIATSLKTTIFDDLNNNDERGYSFLSDRRNPFRAHIKDLCEFLFKRTARNEFVIGINNDGQVIWNCDSLNRWMQSASNLHNVLWVLMHLTSGLPARGEEYRSYLVRNTNKSERSFYFVDKMIMTLQNYHKGSNLAATPVKLIPRFLPPCLTRLFIEYFLLVRSTQCVAARALYGDEVAQQYSDVFPISMGNLQNGSDLSRLLQDTFSESSIGGIGLKQYRHVATFFADLISTEHPALPFEESAGHSVATASHHYAQRENDMRAIDRGRLDKFKLVSLKWHNLLKLNLPSYSPPQINPCLPETPSLFNSLSSAQTNEGRASVIERLIEVPRLASPDIQFSFRANNALKHLGLKSWRSPEQAIAVSRVLECTTDFIAVFPTGHGKSLLFLAAAVDNAMKTTVVVVPLKMLIEGHIATCQRYNVSCVQWTSKNKKRDPPSIVFVSAEHATTDVFVTYLRTLSIKGLLHSVFIDEIHLLLSEFRPRLRDLTHLATVNHPLIGMTASLRPNGISQLSEFLHTKFELLRLPTVRPNIQYQVVIAPDINQTLIDTINFFLSNNRGSRAIVYAMTKADVNAIQVLLLKSGSLTAILHSDLPDQEKKLQLNDWVRGPKRVMVATSLLGCGFDLPDVHLVVHFGYFHSLDNYHQESGRCGRDGKNSVSVVITNDSYQQKICHITQNSNNDAQVWIAQREGCRRNKLHMTIDGISMNCFLWPGALLCDLCQSFQIKPISSTSNNVQGLAVRSAVNKYVEVQSLKDLRDINTFLSSGWCAICYAKSKGQIREQHEVVQCSVIKSKGHGTRCYKCLGPHFSKNCQNQIQTTEGVCNRCYFQIVSIGTTSVHNGPWGSRCQNQSGDSLRCMIWWCWRDENLNQTIYRRCRFLGDRKSTISSVDGEESRSFSKVLVQIEPGQLLHNFTRVAAEIIRILKGN